MSFSTRPTQRIAWIAIFLLLGAATIAAVWWLWSDDDLLADHDLPITISQQLGIAALEEKLGYDAPTGRGIVTGHVESMQAGGYLPAMRASRFAGVTFTPRSGKGKTTGHASATATILYGKGGLAPGIQQVYCFSAEDWLGDGFLNLGREQPAAGAGDIRLFTHSWVSYDLQPMEDILARTDEVVDEQGVVIVAGVNNGKQSTIPPVLASAYNVIAVGNSEGDSSGGYTSEPFPGRSKPDLVAPGGLTSFATPAVAAMVARLMETADQQKIARIAQPLVIKAALMAGAIKPKGWQPAADHPLDEHLGAGLPQLDRSHAMLMNPLAARPPALAGYDYRQIQPGQTLTYRLLAHQPLRELSVVLTWHRRVDSTIQPDFFNRRVHRVYSARLAQMNLTLLRSDLPGFSQLAASTSAVDNVQHVYLRDLPAGRYDLVISRRDGLDENWDYALAWWAGQVDENPSAE